MADVPVNTNTPIRFEAGGIFRLNDGVADYTFINRENGSVEIEAGGYEALEYNDRGLQQTPLEGDEQPTMIRVRAKFSRGLGTGEINTLGVKRDTATGLKALFICTLEFPHFKGAAAKQQCTVAGCWFDSPPKIKQGEKFDTIEVVLKSKTALPTWALI